MLKKYEKIISTNDFDMFIDSDTSSNEIFEVFKNHALYKSDNAYVLFYIHDEWGNSYDICEIY